MHAMEPAVPTPHYSSMPSKSTNPPKSAVPTVYYVIFGVIEPLITFSSLLEAILAPQKVCGHISWGCQT